MPNLTQSFIDALHRLETDRDVEAIAGLFSPDAEIANPFVQYEDGGDDAARRFWGQYRDAFDEIASDFRTVSAKDGVSFLEWTSRGSIGGQAFSYEGVSVLETGSDKITAFRTYFDTRHLPAARSKGGETTGRVPLPGQQPNAGNRENSESASEDQMVEAQRDAAEERAAGGYQ